MDLTTMSVEDINASIATSEAEVSTIFAMNEADVTVAHVQQAEELTASITAARAELAQREQVAVEAGNRFAALRATFSGESVEAAADEDAEEDAPAEEEDEEPFAGETVEASAEDAEETEEASAEEVAAEDAAVEDSALTAGAAQAMSQTIKPSAARRVATKAARPTAPAAAATRITAAADVQGFATGQALDGMDQVAQALMARGRGFAKFNAQSARTVHSQTGGAPLLNKFGVASFGVDLPSNMIATKGNDYAAVQAALKSRDEEVLTAGGWCAPSENLYGFLADYKVDGLLSMSEVGVPRGGLNITQGPFLSTQGTALDDFGFTQTEAQAIARVEKTCETIECPEFEEVRLDAIGYCYKIPFLTQHAYPEVVTHALRLASVLYAHKVNRRIINDVVDLSQPLTATGIGASVTDTLEALSVLAHVKRRKWNLGNTAKIEVKLPQWVLEVFRSDMSRRTGLALTDIATEQKIASEFAARNLVVEYVSDWQELPDNSVAFPATFEALMYPAGTFVKGIEDVVNLSAVYDAASLEINEYTGVFFEQGILVAKMGYESNVVTIPICSAGNTGAQVLLCGDGSI